MRASCRTLWQQTTTALLCWSARSWRRRQLMAPALETAEKRRRAQVRAGQVVCMLGK